jgi:hypothetical protein
MRSGRFALLAGLAAGVAVTALAWAAARRTSTGDEVSAAPVPSAPPASAAAPGPTRPPAVAAPAPAPVRPAPAPPAGDPAPPARPAADEQAAAARIDALVRAGEIGRARDLAEEFLRLHPLSSYCQHIETLTGVHPRPPIPGE